MDITLWPCSSIYCCGMIVIDSLQRIELKPVLGSIFDLESGKSVLLHKHDKVLSLIFGMKSSNKSLVPLLFEFLFVHEGIWSHGWIPLFLSLLLYIQNLINMSEQIM